MFINNFQSAKVKRKNETAKLFLLIFVKIFEKLFIISLIPLVFCRLRYCFCFIHTTTRLADSSVFSTHHRCAVSAFTPHCAPLRFAYVGLLKYSVFDTTGTTSFIFSKNPIRILTIQIEIVNI